MRMTLSGWAVLAALGMLIWLTSVDVATHPGTHPLYRLAVAIGILSWFGWLARDARSR